MKLKNLMHFLRDESGYHGLLELAIVMPMLLLLLFGAVDLGRFYYLTQQMAGAAHAAVEYAVQNPTDTTGIQNAATDDVDPSASSISAGTPTYGCECSDGSQYSSNCTTKPTTCTYNVVYRVSIVVSTTYTTMFPWPGIPSSFSVSSTAAMRTSL
jgi:Flp pilus assembly protein TadG